MSKGKELLLRYCSAALQGSVKQGYSLLKEATDKPKYISKFEQRIYRRFMTSKPRITIPTKIRWVRKVIQTFHRHWIGVLSEQTPPHQSKEELRAELNNLLGTANCSFDELDKRLELQLAEHGLYFSGDTCHPNLRSAYIYTERKECKYNVSLPNNRKCRLVVYLMDDFICQDWLPFATFGMSSNGGWAKVDSLYCVAGVYDLNSSNFKLSYLKHEAQHVDDYKRFPRLVPPQGYSTSKRALREALFLCSLKEYRAKLVEIVYAKTNGALTSFLNQAADDPNAPHRVAALKIVKELKNDFDLADDEGLLQISSKRLSKAAASLFTKSTDWLEKLENKSLGKVCSVMDVDFT